MKIRRIALMVVVAATALAASLVLTSALASARPAPEDLSLSESSPTADWTLQGRVFRGPVGDETHPLAGVVVEAYGGNDPYPSEGSFIVSATTDINGWYALTVPDRYEFYHIREVNPPGFVSVGATTVSGTVRTNDWIEYVYPLTDTVLTGNKFWDRLPWGKWVNGKPWNPDLIVTAETSDTIKVVDVINTLDSEPLKLIEHWNPAHLQLVEHWVEPEGSSVLVEDGALVWDVPEGEQRVFTMTKWFHVEPCTWTTTILREELLLRDDVLEQRPVTIDKKPPQLWIDSVRDPEVYAGEVATFTLSFGNDGGTEGGVWIKNEFPPEARLVWSAPPPDDVAGEGLQAWWIIGELPGGTSGDIMVGVAISETVPESTTIEISDWIYDHTGEQVDATVITYHVESPPGVEWVKWVNGEPWNPDLVVTAQTSDTVDVIDVVDSDQPFNLAEFWDPGRLELLAYHVTAGEIVTADGRLEWIMSVVPQGVVTLTKRFHVEPCMWEMAVIEELLSVQGTPEPLARFVPVAKPPPELWIESLYEPPVLVGEPATFVLHYGNGGGREFGAQIRNEFPESARFVESVPPPTHLGPDGLWATWDIELLETGQQEAITVVVGITPELPPSTTIPIWDGIFNHAGELMDEVVTEFHVPFPPVTFPEGEWPWYAQEEILVHPEPPIAAHPTELCAEVVNHDPDQPHTVILEFSVANFGIGVPFTPVDVTEVEVPPKGHAVGCVIWVPPTPDHWCIQVRIMGPNYPYMISQRNVDVDEPLVPGEPHTIEFPVGNPTGMTETIHLELVNPAPKWVIELSPNVLPDLAPKEVRPVHLTVVPPPELPPDGHVVVDVEAYARDKLIGGFRKFFRPPVILHRFPDPPYAEREITVHPYPARAGEPTEVCVELHNPTPFPQDGVVFFSWANFGIGIPFTPINGPRPVHLPPYSVIKECIHWVPPVSGHVCLQVELEMVGYPPQRSQRNIDVNEPLVPGEPHTLEFPVGNPTEETATIELKFKQHLHGWGIELSPDVLPDMRPGMTETVALTVIPPQDKPLPDDGRPIVDVEAFVGDELIGGLRKIYRPPIQLHPFPDPPYAEREITVHPYPPMAGEPTEICVELYNPTGIVQEVVVQFSWANFGIGIPFTPINGPRVVHLPPHSVVHECIHWIPPTSGHVCLQVELEVGDYPRQRSQRNIDVDEPLVPGEPHTLRFPVGNPFNHPMTITLGLVPHVDRWEFDLSPDVLPNVPPQTTRTVSLTVLPPPGQTLVLPLPPDEPIPPDGVPIVDVEAYARGELIGGFRKVFRPPIPLHPFPDPPYAEREITVEPYPPRAGEPTEVCVELRNPTPYPHDATVFFSWANFGIGLPFQPINGPRPVHLPPYSIVRECVHWIPPVGGHVCLRVDLEIEGQPLQWSQRNIDVDEPLKPNKLHERVFPVGNPFNHPVTITLGLVPHVPDNWGLRLSHEVLTNVLPGPEGVRKVALIVTPPDELVDDGHPIVDVEAFVEGELIGGFRKIFRPPVPVHRPKDPIYAESEIFVHPYPPRAREPTELGVEIRNPTDEPETVTVTFSFANFGIGLPFHPINGPITVTVPDHGMVRPVIIWIPPDGGLWCIQVEIEIPGHKEVFYSQRNIDVGEPLRPLTPHSRPFLVGNPFNDPVTITLGLIPHFPDWGLELSDDVLTNVLPGPAGAREVILTVTPPADLPWDGDPIVDVEAFVEGQLIGGFRKIYRPDVPIHRPRDPVYAESEIGVDPYPVVPGQPVKLSVEVFNPTDQDRFVTATFAVANFGIGLPFSTTHIMPNPIRIFVPRHGAARGHVVWRPPHWRGKFCVRVTLQMEGHEPIWSQRNIDVGEPLKRGRPHSLTFPVGGWPHTEPVTVSLGLINHRDGWDVRLSDTTLEDLTQPVSVTLTVTPSANARLGTGEPIVDVEGYVDGELIGGFRKLDVPPIDVHKPHEKVYAETELSIDPDPPRKGQEARISAVIQNNGPTTSTVTVLFGWAKFGMGIPFTTTNVVPPTQTLKLGSAVTATASVSWTPMYAGSQCVQVIVIDPEHEYEDLVSMRNVRVVDRPPCDRTKTFTLTVYNDSPFTVTVDIGLMTFDVPADWNVTTVPSDTLELGPFSEGIIQIIVEIPCPLTVQAMRTLAETRILQQEAGGVPTIDVEGYVDGELVGGIEIQFEGEPVVSREVYLPVVLRDS